MKNEQLPTESPIELTTDSLATDQSSTKSITTDQSASDQNMKEIAENVEDDTIKPALTYQYEEWFNELKPEILNVAETEMLDLRTPPDKFLVEADAMITTVNHFQESFIQSGFDMGIIEALSKRIGAARMAQTLMDISKRELEDSRSRWATIIPVVFELRDSMYYDFKFACRNNKAILDILKELGKGRSVADMIQDLHTLGHLGDGITAELDAINFDFTKLETAKAYTMELGQLQREVSLKGAINKTDRIVRNKAFTLINIIMADIRKRARWVYRNDKKILNKFLSTYKRSQYTRKRRNAEEVDNDTLGDSALDESSSEAV